MSQAESQQNGTPGQQNGTPGQQNGTPGQQNGTPGQQNATPGQQNGPPGKAFKPLVVDGVAIPRMFEKGTGRPMQEHVQLVRALDMRDDDVILVAFPKSGTHWIWEVTSMLVSGKAEYEKRTKEFTMMEATSIEQMQTETSPRIFNSHLPFSHLPRQIPEKKVKVIHVYRNAKDVLVSMLSHVRQIEPSTTLEDMENKLLSNKGPRSYMQYLESVDDYRQNNPHVPFFTLCYEDCKENPEKVIKDLAQFLGVKASDQLCADIAQATSFKSMKQADSHKDYPDLPHIQIYRKGEVGDWKNHLTVAVSERIDAAMTQLSSRDFRFRYTL